MYIYNKPSKEHQRETRCSQSCWQQMCDIWDDIFIMEGKCSGKNGLISLSANRPGWRERLLLSIWNDIKAHRAIHISLNNYSQIMSGAFFFWFPLFLQPCAKVVQVIIVISNATLAHPYQKTRIFSCHFIPLSAEERRTTETEAVAVAGWGKETDGNYFAFLETSQTTTFFFQILKILRAHLHPVWTQRC